MDDNEFIHPVDDGYFRRIVHDFWRNETSISPEVMISGNRIPSTNVAILFYTLKQYALDFATLIGGRFVYLDCHVL